MEENKIPNAELENNGDIPASDEPTAPLVQSEPEADESGVSKVSENTESTISAGECETPQTDAPSCDGSEEPEAESIAAARENEAFPTANHSGEYRYVPPYAGIGSNTPPSAPKMSSQDASFGDNGEKTVKKEKKEKKKREKKQRSYSTAAVAMLLVGAMILSFAAGMGGAVLVNEVFYGDETESEKDDELVFNENDDINNGETVIFEGSYDLSDISAAVSASVVEITTEFNKTYYGYYQYVEEGAGSGVIVSDNGYIITNNHVITDSATGVRADSITVRLINGEEYKAEIKGNDSDSDIALLKIDAKGLSAANIGNSDELKVGEQVIAVGNPLGELGGTVTTGIISATNREISVENNKMTLIQTDAAINPGNSGGGLFNIEGELIGIVNAKTTDVTVEGLGFAIPINEACYVAKELEENGYVTGKPYVGISLYDVTDSYIAYYYFRSEATGVYVNMVQEGYNEKVLKYGDRITAVDGNEVSSSEDVKEAIKSSEVGDVLVFTISRKGKIKNVKVKCYEYVPETDISFDED
ncbi:MAG: trypsin-like serine protease [Ruminococcaceae bacterium]|nr:trypsin-like serine protease [Oscillospiraceae bacterium]